MPQYDWVTNEAFDRALAEITEEQRHTLLSVPGVWEVVSEELNNEALDMGGDFDDAIQGILTGMAGITILAIPGMYEVLREEFNNYVLEDLEEQRGSGREAETQHIAQDDTPTPVANPEAAVDNYGDPQRLFRFTFGAYGEDKVLVWGDSFETALDVAVAWLGDVDRHNAVFVTDEELQELYQEAQQELGPEADPDDIQDAATVDLTYADDRWIDYNWTVDDIYDNAVIEDALQRSQATQEAARHEQREDRGAATHRDAQRAPGIVIRMGDRDDYHWFGNIYDAAEELRSLDEAYADEGQPGIGPVVEWRRDGFETTEFRGNNYISLYRGDQEFQPTGDQPDLDPTWHSIIEEALGNQAPQEDEVQLSLERPAAVDTRSSSMNVQDKINLYRRLLRKAEAQLRQAEDGPNIPREPRDYTAQDQQQVIDFFAAMSLKELRRRQDLTQQQIGTAFEQRNDDALANLRMLEALLAAAVDQREFGREAAVNRTAWAPDNFQRDDFEEFFDGYLETALWSSLDYADESGGEPMDRNYTTEDIADECLEAMRVDCQKFFDQNRDVVDDADFSYGPDFGRWGHVGYDFWLTRNGHGAGFWDGDYSEPAGEILTEASEQFGEINLYVGDDGQIYCEAG